MTRRSVTVDTSVLVPALASWHPRHETALAVVARRATAVPAHVLLETYAVLTRLPALQRIAPAVAGEALAALDLPKLELPGSAYADLVADLAAGGLRGGATYDGLVAATALHHGLALVTADSRARPVYDLVGVTVESLV